MNTAFLFRQFRAILILVTFVSALLAIPATAGEQWQPVTREELDLKNIPESPGSDAVVLYRSVERHDDQGYEDVYVRIKILTQEGTRYANIETPPFVRDYGFIDDVRGRTIRPDGTTVAFTGQVFEKLIVKNRSFKQVALTFTMPDVQAGSIIEYRYRERFSTEWAEQYGTEWQVQDELFVRRAKFSLRPSSRFRVKWVTAHLMDGAAPKRVNGNIVLNVENVPAFEPEEYMPPESEVRARVYFFYTEVFEPESTEEYWKKSGEEWKKKAERFMDRRPALQREIAAVLTPEDDTPEAKMRRLYVRVQEMRNLTWDINRSEKEDERERLRPNSNVEDLLRHGYGTHDEINRLYAGLLREAGIETALMRVSEREDTFFHAKIPLWDQLQADIVIARQGNNEYFLDPGTPYCPFGELPWQHTSVLGWRSDTMTLAEVPGTKPENTTETRTGRLFLDKQGTLTGTLQISYTGFSALNRRLSTRDNDETERRRNIEDEVKGWLPMGASVQVTKMEGWVDSELPLTITFKLTIDRFGTSSGTRLMLPIAVFHAQDIYPFQSPKRVHNVYFRYCFRVIDDVTITLADGVQLSSLPDPKSIDASFARYSSSMKQSGNTLQISRELAVNNLMFSVEDYPKLQYFYKTVKSGDGEEAVLISEPSQHGR